MTFDQRVWTQNQLKAEFDQFGTLAYPLSAQQLLDHLHQLLNRINSLLDDKPKGKYELRLAKDILEKVSQQELTAYLKRADSDQVRFEEKEKLLWYIQVKVDRASQLLRHML